MKKWMYVISVGSMLAIFLVFYLSETKKHAEKERQHQIAAAAQQAAKDAEKKRIQDAARADAEKRAAWVTEGKRRSVEGGWSKAVEGSW